MYNPAVFREERTEVLHKAIRSHPLGLLITYGPSGLTANPLPFVLSADERPVLSAHLSKANPQIWDLEAGSPTLVIFQGPQAYISPSWYPGKREHGKVVPTWNYVVVQARGKPRLVNDVDWLREHVDALTIEHEAAFDDPWAVSDAPAAYVDKQLQGIIGIQIQVEELQGKWKVSQNKSDADRTSVSDGLRSQCAHGMASLIAEN